MFFVPRVAIFYISPLPASCHRNGSLHVDGDRTCGCNFSGCQSWLVWDVHSRVQKVLFSSPLHWSMESD